ncbi:MAG: hypothetical protein C0507_10750 [Cyanobacteria bacterium PR.3.49]|nr:hypothetical protein [Cyanobacteria bacterium PR.3.49]
MNLRTRNSRWLSLLTSVALWCSVVPVVAQPVQSQALDAENIAAKSLSVAQSMKSTGYCYAGVSKALSPLGVVLTGEAAFQARDLLLADSRFTPISLDDNSELQRGDILVFNKSSSRPYGHICVYQGNDQESSDHVSRLTSPEPYGGLTVFRLQSENARIASASHGQEWTFRMPVAAPDFRQPDPSAVPVRNWPQKGPSDTYRQKPLKHNYSDTKNSGIIKRAATLIDRHFAITNSTSSRKALKDKLIRFVIQNL